MPGEFRSFDVHYIEGESLLVTVDLMAADMGDPDMNDVLADPAWFGSDSNPEAKFGAVSIRQTAPGRFSADGLLTLKGVERAITVPFAWRSGDGHATMSGKLTMQRTDYDVGSGEWSTGESIGLDVALRFDVKLAPCD